MDRDWPAVADEFAATVTGALAAAGGVTLARSAESDPSVRTRLVQKVLAEVGLLSMDVRADEEESAAAVRGVQAAGAVVAPWPVAGALAAGPGDTDAVYVVDRRASRLEHADLFAAAVVADLADPDRGGRITATSEPRRAPLDPFGCEVRIEAAPADAGLADNAAWRGILDAAWVLGALDTAVTQAARYSLERKQFGARIGSFGEIKWRLADMAIARDGLDELLRHTWWTQRTGAAGRTDLLALRLQTIEAAGCVLGNAHQVFGAIGLCDEHDLAVIDRHLQPVLNRPCGATGTLRLLANAVATDGFDAIFPVPPRTGISSSTALSGISATDANRSSHQ